MTLTLSAPAAACLGHYRHPRIGKREIVAHAGPGGSTLVVDRDARTARDARLVAHLYADEPAGNAALVCHLYLACSRPDSPFGRPRRVTPRDFERAPLTRLPAAPAAPLAGLMDAFGFTYRIERVRAAGMWIPELRWLRRVPAGALGTEQVVSLREVIGRVQDYEPARELTAAAAERHDGDPTVSVAVLRAELARVGASRIVLNRGLREAVLKAVASQGISMSQIAVRCGHLKRDARGNVSGETSWLGRRLGLLPEGGEVRATPWIHSDVLALIARRGLGVSPREVELG